MEKLTSVVTPTLATDTINELAEQTASVQKLTQPSTATQITNKINEIIDNMPSGGGDSSTWTRPSWRLTKPTLNDNEVLWLYGVKDTTFNWLCFSAATDGTQYKIDWGDGTVETLNNNAIAFHDYSYSALTNVQPDQDGYKEVWVKLTPVNAGENLITLTLNARPSWMTFNNTGGYVAHVLELYIKASHLDTIVWARITSGYMAAMPFAGYRICDIFGLYENSLTSSDAMCAGFNSLKLIENLDINNIPLINSFMHSCYVYNKPFPSNVNFNNVGPAFMHSCYSYNQPFHEGVGFKKAGHYFMYYCYSYNKPFPSTAQIGLQANSRTFLLLETYAFYDTIDVYVPSSSTESSITILSNSNCTGIRIRNMGTALATISFYNFSKLTREMCVQVFNDLYDRTGIGGGTINITNTYASVHLTTADRLIATNKNWEIIGG